MLKYEETIVTLLSKEELFNLVIDIEKYPDFLPWCVGARIKEKNEKKIIADLLVRFNHLNECYTSLVTFDFPNKICVKAIKGPLKTLINKWEFRSIENGATELHFAIEFELKSKILDVMMGSVFEKAAKKITVAFMERAISIDK